MALVPKICSKFKILLISSFLILLNSCNRYSRSDESKIYINEPEIGDVYLFKVSKKEYSLMKIARIDVDYISFNMNAIKLNRTKFMDESLNSIQYRRTPEFNLKKYWTDSIQTFSRAELKEKYNSEIIYEILRDL